MPWPKGKPRSAETRAKISASSIASGRRPPSASGRSQTACQREATRNRMIGHIVSPGQRDAISRALAGRIPSLANRLSHGTEEARKKLRLSHIGRRPSAETRQKMSLSHQALYPQIERTRVRSNALLRDLILSRDGAVCGLCRSEIDLTRKSPDPWSLSVDHRVPLALGGSHSVENVQPAHRFCNTSKGARYAR